MNHFISKKAESPLSASLIFFTVIAGIGLSYIIVNYPPVFALIAIFGIPAGLLFLKYPAIGIILNVGLIPFENINTITLFSLSVFELFTLFTYSAAVLHHLVHKKGESLVKTQVNWFLLVFILSVVLSNLVALDQERSVSGTLRLLRNISLYAFVINLISSKKTFYPLLWVFILSGVASALYGLYGYYFDHSLLDPQDLVLRVRGTMNDPNEFAGAMVVRMMLAIGFLQVVSKEYQKVLLGAAILILAYSILLSGSRGGILGMGAAFIAYIVTREKQWKLLIVGVFLAAIGLIVMPLSLKQRIGLVEADGNVGNNLDRRMTYLMLGEEIIKENPVLGIGLDGFATAYAQSEYRFLSSSSRGRIAHNTYLEIATGMGIPGLILFLILIGYAYFKVLAMARNKALPDLAKISAGLFAGLTGYFIVAFFLSQQYEKTLWLLLGIVVIIEQLSLREASPSFIETRETIAG